MSRQSLATIGGGRSKKARRADNGSVITDQDQLQLMRLGSAGKVAQGSSSLLASSGAQHLLESSQKIGKNKQFNQYVHSETKNSMTSFEQACVLPPQFNTLHKSSARIISEQNSRAEIDGLTTDE